MWNDAKTFRSVQFQSPLFFLLQTREYLMIFIRKLHLSVSILFIFSAFYLFLDHGPCADDITSVRDTGAYLGDFFFSMVDQFIKLRKKRLNTKDMKLFPAPPPHGKIYMYFITRRQLDREEVV
jgi:hypothetical protein